MMRVRIIFATLAAAFTLSPAPADAMERFRFAYVAEAPAPCAAPAADAPAGLSAYAAHLSARLERPVEVCAVADDAGAAALIASGGADMAQLGPEAFAAAGQARAILTGRLAQDFGRVEMVAAVLATSAMKDVADLAGKRAALGGGHPVAAEGPFRALRDAGVEKAEFGRIEQLGDAEPAIAALRAGRVDVALLHVSAWGRVCRADRPDENPCADLRALWQGRPRPSSALVIPLSMPDEIRYRLIGIHVALHLDAPEAFAWLAPAGAQSFDPTEARALAIGR